MKNEEIFTDCKTPTIKEIVESTDMTQTAFAKKFDIPLRTVQNWVGGQRQCPEYVRKMMETILKNEKEEKKMMVQFEAGNGVNYLKGESKDLSVYAECEVPEDASDDYGYITMRDAILEKLTEDEKKTITFWYDGQEQYLAEDAKADCDVDVDIER